MHIRKAKRNGGTVAPTHPTGRRKKTLTLLHIPDPNKTIRTIHIPYKLIYGLPTVLVCTLLSATIWQTNLYHQLQNKIRTQSDQIRAGENEYTMLRQDKNAVIEHLQNELLDLSRQTDQLGEEMASLQKLAAQLKTMAIQEGIDWPDSAPPTVEALSLNRGRNKDGVEKRLDSPLANLAGKNEHMNSMGGEMVFIGRHQMEQWLSELHTAVQDFSLSLDRLSEQMQAAGTALEQRIERVRHTPSIWPVHSRAINSGFGIRRDPFTGSAAFHDGLDIGGKLRDPVMTTADGIVLVVGSDAARGNYIIIDHGHGLRTVYMHLYSFLVKKGQVVHKGDTIARIGTTGRSTGPHLHYSVMRDGEMINPLVYLPKSS